MKRLFLLIIAVGLVACGGSGGDEPVFDVTEPIAEQGVGETAVCTPTSFGRSIALFPQEGAELMVNGFDFPAGAEVNLRLTAVTDNDNTQIERTPTVNDDGMFSETIALPEYDYMRWAVRLQFEQEVHCHYIIMGHEGWLELGYEGPEATDVTDAALQDDMALMSEQTGIPLEEIEMQLANEEAFTRLNNQLLANEADTYSGMWFEWEPKAQAVYAFTQNGEETVAKYLPIDDPLWELIEVRTLQFTQDELMAHQEMVNSQMQDAPFEWGTAVLSQQGVVELMVPAQTIWRPFVEEQALTLPPSVRVVFSFTEEELTFTPPPNLNPAENITMAQRRTPSLFNMEALMMSNLLVEDGCLFGEDGGQRQLIVWQPGYFVHDTGSHIQILDQDGVVVAEEGQPLFMGGGEGNWQSSVSLIDPIPENCLTNKVWYIGNFLPEEYRENVAPSDAP